MFNAPSSVIKRAYAGMIAFGCAGFITLVNAQFVSEEVVYDNILGKITGQYPRTIEYGDEILLAGDGRKVTKFEFEYLGQFEPEGDETCIVRFYTNDGEETFEASSPGTLLFESAPFTIFPDYNTAIIDDIAVDVPDSFTFTVEFGGLSGRSTDRASLLLRDPVLVGKSFDDIWVKQGNGWTPWRFNGDPIANFSCRITAEIDFSVKFKTLKRKAGQAPVITVRGPRDQTIIVYASNDKKVWQPIALETLKGRDLTLVDEEAAPTGPRYYRTSLINSTPIRMENVQVLPDSKSRMSITGPRGLPFKAQASDDFENWSEVFSFSFQTRPITIQDDKAIGKKRRFYRIILNDTVIEDENTIQETIAAFPEDFTLED
jgi:hypothetical protein